MSQFLDFLFGKGEKTQQFQKYTPQQQQVLGQLLGGASGQLPQAFDFLSSILSQDPEAIARFEAPTRRAFEEQTVPSIAERFTGMNAQKSSAFGQQLGQAGQRLEEGLAAQRGKMGFDALNQLRALLGSGLTQQYDTLYAPQSFGLMGEIGEKGVEMLPMLLKLLSGGAA